MKNILNIFASISLITVSASSVTACGDTKKPFNPFNLSTWGTNQINLIQSYYLSDFILWYQKPSPTSPYNYKWSDWLKENTLEQSLNQINPNIDLGRVPGSSENCAYEYNPQPRSGSDTKTILTNGLTVFLQGDKTKYIEGSRNFTLKL